MLLHAINATVRSMSLIDRCIKLGLRMTEQRKVIAEVIESSIDHPDVNTLFERTVKRDNNISIATIYRTMRLFEETGVVEKHDFGYGKSRYEDAEGSHHDHLIDIENDKVIEFTNEEIEKLQEQIANKLGYKIIDHRLELYCVPIKK